MHKNIYKTLLVIPNLGKGGAQQVFRQQFDHLSSDFNILGCVFNWDDSFQEDRLRNIVSLDVPAGKNYLSKIYFFVLRTVRLKRLKKQNQIDISISHLEGADYVNLLSKDKDKVVCWIHGTKRHDGNIDGLIGWLRKNILIPRLYGKADRIVTVSQGIASEFSNHFKSITSPIQTIYNGFDLKKIKQLSFEKIDNEFLPIFDNSKVIITHCRLSKQKNLFALLSIFNRLESEADAKLVVLGEGELQNELLAFCQKLGLRYWACWDDHVMDMSRNIYFMGQQQNPFKFLRMSSLYILTSGWEGFPLSLCEAIICDLPVITSDCFTGPREIIAPDFDGAQPVSRPYYTDFGVLMPIPTLKENETITIWCNELVELLNKYKPTEMAATSQEQISSFDISISHNQTDQLLKDLMHGK